jgi:hypothetical protein
VAGKQYPPGFNPTYWQDFFKEQERKEVISK